jgi:hypothetical protein
MAEENGYFGLDDLGEPPDITDTKQESYQEDNLKDNQSKAESPYDIYERYGKYWIKETKDGIEPGISETGEVLDDALYEEAVITFVKGCGQTKLIGLKRTDYIDALGIPYKPCIRGLCYIHPENDDGMGDGQNIRELQTATDDTFNASQDRVILATFPTLKVTKQSLNENSTVYIEPGHSIELNDINDLQEFRVTDNIGGALNQLQYLDNVGRQASAMNETTTGGVPSIASTTATAVSAATQSSNTRLNYKSLSYENTALLELYWMIQQMTYRFATDRTGFELMGDKLYNFDPSLNYYFTPLSQSIEPESSKAAKLNTWTQLYQITAQTQNPSTAKRMNQIYGEIVKLMGDEYENVIPLDENAPVQQGGQQASVEGMPMSNQYGMTQSPEEAMARG